jgi:hypothetical protein
MTSQFRFTLNQKYIETISVAYLDGYKNRFVEMKVSALKLVAGLIFDAEYREGDRYLNSKSQNNLIRILKLGYHYI